MTAVSFPQSENLPIEPFTEMTFVKYYHDLALLNQVVLGADESWDLNEVHRSEIV